MKFNTLSINLLERLKIKKYISHRKINIILKEGNHWDIVHYKENKQFITNGNFIFSGINDSILNIYIYNEDFCKIFESDFFLEDVLDLSKGALIEYWKYKNWEKEDIDNICHDILANEFKIEIIILKKNNIERIKKILIKCQYGKDFCDVYIEIHLSKKEVIKYILLNSRTFHYFLFLTAFSDIVFENNKLYIISSLIGKVYIIDYFYDLVKVSIHEYSSSAKNLIDSLRFGISDEESIDLYKNAILMI